MPEIWQRCYEAFLQSIFDISGSLRSRETYHSNLTRFFAHCGKAPGEVTRTDVLAFMQSPSTSRRSYGKPAGASTKNGRLCAVTSFYKFASVYEMDGQPLYQKMLPTQGLRYLKRDAPYRSMNTDELRRFFAAIPADTLKGLRDRAIFAMYFWTARRRNELAAIRWRDIEPTIIVDENGARRPGHVYRYHPKGRHRTVKTKELPSPAYKAIERYLEAGGRLFTIRADDFLFVSIKPGRSRSDKPLHHDYINQLFKHYCRLAGLEASRLSLHSLRHTAARERYNAGADIRSIQQVLDHSTLSVTDTYLRTLAPEDDSGARLLEQRYGL
jgi:integrase/recombinase XerC